MYPRQMNRWISFSRGKKGGLCGKKTGPVAIIRGADEQFTGYSSRTRAVFWQKKPAGMVTAGAPSGAEQIYDNECNTAAVR
jgi:hypothetical protein